MWVDHITMAMIVISGRAACGRTEMLARKLTEGLLHIA